MSSSWRPVEGLSDIAALERVSFEEAVPSKTVHDLLAASAREFGERPALRYLKTAIPGEPVEVLSHRQFFARVTQIANLFSALGVGPDDTVALLPLSTPDAHCALWAAECVGVACPINFLLQIRDIVSLLETSRAKVLVIPGRELAPDVYERALQARRQVASIQAVVVLGEEAEESADVYALQSCLDRYSSDQLSFDYRKTPEDRAALFHTGGTTGCPKLAIHRQSGQAFVAWALARMFGLGCEDVFMNGLPLFHVGGTIDFSLAPLSVGASIVVPTVLGMRHPNLVKNHWKIVEQEHVTVVSGIPTSIAALLSSPVDGADISSVRAGITGGSAFPEGVAREFERRFGIRIVQIYGMTETSGLLTCSSPRAEWQPSSSGFRLPFTSLKVVRNKGKNVFEDCAVGVAGQVMVKGPHVFDGYLGATQTIEKDDEGWLMTGDLGYFDEQGRLYLTGRAKDLIIRSGHNIDPQSIEEAACKHPAVELCAAVGMPDEYAGEVPVAYVTLKPGAAAEASDVQSFIAENIPEPPARPKDVFIVGEIPTTAVGKIFKPRLRCDAAVRGIDRLLAKSGVKAEVSVEEDASAGLFARVRVKEGQGKGVAERLAFLQIRFEVVESSGGLDTDSVIAGGVR